MQEINSSKIILFLFLALFTCSLQGQTNMDKLWGEGKVSGHHKKSETVRLFDNGNFGMFIHFGLFSHLGGEWQGKTYYGIGEWIMNPRMAGIPVDEYMDIAKEFNPSEFSGEDIAKLAKDAGMKYIIITSKHHDGFAMFDSEHPFNIVDSTPYGKDPMKELSQACRKYGLGFGFYYSHNQDWTEPGGFGGPDTNAEGEPAGFQDYYQNKCKVQVKEICSNYGDIDFIWFDTPGKMPEPFVKELVDIVKDLQPNALLCSRVGYGMGDYLTRGDMEVPQRNYSGLWETADTNNDSWSFAWYDNNFKSPEIILHRLINTVARGGTYLFNVGPDGTGKVPETGQEFLRETGKWIKENPDVIYGAGSSPWGHELAWGDVTTQGNILNLCVFEWPENGKLYLPGLENPIASAKLSDGSHVSYTRERDWVVFNLPCKPISDFVSVIKVELKNNAPCTVDSLYGIYPNMGTTLLSEFSEVKGAVKKETRWMEKFGEWKHVNQISEWQKDGVAEWNVNVSEPGLYYLGLSYAGEGPVVWKTITDEGVLVQNQQPATSKYQEYEMGILKFNTGGKHTISVSLVNGDAQTTSLKAVHIEPVYMK